MRIALTHNLRLSDSEEEAEFDTQATVDALAGALERLGHRVERLEVTGPASRTVARLEAYAPDLIFNTAEGRRGRFREAFYPALFDELGFPFTGSDAYALAITLDKQLTKMLVSKAGIGTPVWQFVEKLEELEPGRFRFPVIAKPNFEGSSKGITQDSVIEEPGRLAPYVAGLLRRYPAGVLVEDFIPGRDVTVPFLEHLQDTPGAGVLAPTEYGFDASKLPGRRHEIYDYALKPRADSAVTVKAPASLEPEVEETLRVAARKVLQALDCRDLARL